MCCDAYGLRALISNKRRWKKWTPHRVWWFIHDSYKSIVKNEPGQSLAIVDFNVKCWDIERTVLKQLNYNSKICLLILIAINRHQCMGSSETFFWNLVNILSIAEGLYLNYDVKEISSIPPPSFALYALTRNAFSTCKDNGGGLQKTIGCSNH